ncbi:hypothetical protein AB0C61_33355 [Streptomyces sp. NPDC048680]|uniref:hypothetical protein n=1 Tax=Streptomyces sp. NPDC048680 TaxID=3155492 RepID=UPI003426E2C8
MEAKLARLMHEQRRREVTMRGKGALAHVLPYGLFAADPDTAAFIAYITARAYMRSVFTNGRQRQVYDGVAEALFQRLRARPEQTCWSAVAHVHPTSEVLVAVSDEDLTQLLVRWNGFPRQVADLLEDAWNRYPLERETMIVHRGDDSSTWNQAAQAWNTARAHWFAILSALGQEKILDRVCPGKVPRLMAADVAYWHRMSGGGLHPDTYIWAELPLAREVLRGEKECPRSLVDAVCARHGRDPVAGAWTAPRRRLRLSPSTGRPNLYTVLPLRTLSWPVPSGRQECSPATASARRRGSGCDRLPRGLGKSVAQNGSPSNDRRGDEEALRRSARL